jgi:hypothetical protein
MIVVTSRTSGTRIELVCCICRERLALASSWLAFPADAEGQEGKFVHGACARGSVQALLGTKKATFMRADMALSHLATSLSDTHTSPVMVRGASGEVAHAQRAATGSARRT